MFATRRTILLSTGLLATGATALLSACQQGDATASNSSDMTIGGANARVHLIEYASVTCSHCREFHETAWPRLRENYIDNNRIKFTFREFPTPPAPVAVAGFQLARCGGADAQTYFTRIEVLFTQQQNILGSGSMQGVRDALIDIGRAAGLSEEQVATCISDQAAPARIQAVVQEGMDRFSISGTPSFVLNDRPLTDPSVVTYEGLSAALDAALAAR